MPAAHRGLSIMLAVQSRRERRRSLPCRSFPGCGRSSGGAQRLSARFAAPHKARSISRRRAPEPTSIFPAELRSALVADLYARR